MQLVIISLQIFYQLERHLSLCHIRKSVLFVNIYIVNIYVVKIYAIEVVQCLKLGSFTIPEICKNCRGLVRLNFQ